MGQLGKDVLRFVGVHFQISFRFPFTDELGF